MKSIINSLKAKIEEKKPESSLKKTEKKEEIEKKAEIIKKKELLVEEWDKSQNGEKQSANMETKLAKIIASEILKSSKVLGKIHSNASMRKILEFEKTKEEKIK